MADHKAGMESGANHSEGSAPRQGGKTITLPVEWHYPEGQDAKFANHLIVQADGDVYHLSFFELRPPIFHGTDEEKARQLEAMGPIRATCVARVVVSNSRMPKFAEAINDNIANNPHAVSED